MERVSIWMWVLYCTVLFNACISRYSPDWTSLDSRPLPAWYDEAKFGIFIVWGVYSVPSFGSEWFWKFWTDGVPRYKEFMEKNYRPGFTYADFLSEFTAEFYDPDAWADIIEASGARYVVFTSKHHDGFCLWPTNVSYNWNSMDAGPKRDLLGDLAASLRKKRHIHMGIYHSLFEWYNPMYLHDKSNNFTTQKFVQSKTLAELYELVNTYEPDLLWSDGDIGPDTYWNSTEFLAWLYNDSPVKERVVVNDRWGNGCSCKHGGYYTCTDRFNPGHLINHKWENAMTIDRRSWGFRREARLEDYLTTHQLITQLVTTVSCGGNLLMDIGPTRDGRIVPIFEERMRDIGRWLAVNGEAIYGTRPWTYQNDTSNASVWYTQKGGNVFAISLLWPFNNTLVLGAPTTTSRTTVSLLGHGGQLSWQSRTTGGLTIQVPPVIDTKKPCNWAWTFQLTHLKN